MNSPQDGKEENPSRKLVLVVEDDPTIGELIKDTINAEEHYQASLVNNGADALETLRQVRVSLIVLDVNLPGLSGYDVYDKVQEGLEYGTPVILFMSAGTREREVKSKSKGAAYFLAKPFDLDELLRLVHELAA